MKSQVSFINTISVIAFCIFNCLFITQSQHVQYGFAHRVNTKSNIKYVLNAGANGIEIDVCSDNSYTDWYVSHNDANVCGCSHCDKLSDWLQELAQYLNDNESKKTQLAMLWIDVKTPQDDDMKSLPKIVHSAELPGDIEILYDLTKFDSDGIFGFNQIINTLNNNEGISFFGKKEEEISSIYNFYKTRKFTRGTFNYGNAVGIDENKLSYARKSEFMKSSTNPYGFALVLTWTNAKESSIDDHTDPNGKYYTDGQIYGNAWKEWSNDGGIGILSPAVDGDTEYIARYNTIISNQANTRLATSKDDPFKISLDVN